MENNFDELFDAYKRKKFKKKQGKIQWKNVQGDLNYQLCEICKQIMQPDDLVEQCPHCGRYFHQKHIREWLKIKAKCPVCKE